MLNDLITYYLWPPLIRPYTHKQSAGWGKNACRQGALRAAALTALPSLQHARDGVFFTAAPLELADQAVRLEPPHRLLGAQPSLTIASCCSCHTFCAARSPSMPRAAQSQQPLSNLCDTIWPSHPRVQDARGSPPQFPAAPRNGPPPGPAATSFLSPDNIPRRNVARVILGVITCKRPYYLVMPNDLITYYLWPPLIRPYTHKQSAGLGKNACRQGALWAAALTAITIISMCGWLRC